MINENKLSLRRELNAPGGGKTFAMLVNVVEYVRKNNKSAMVICATSQEVSTFHETLRAIAIELHVPIVEEYPGCLYLVSWSTYVLIKSVRGSKLAIDIKRFVDHGAVEVLAEEYGRC